MSNPYESFYHGLVVSKLWLCEELEKLIDNTYQEKPNIINLGGWHNLLSFMMLVRRPKSYSAFTSYDKDQAATEVANSICDTWRFEEPKIKNITADVDALDLSLVNKNTIFINCSVDQFNSSTWYNTIPYGNIVCMQTTDIVDDNPKWEINQHTKNLAELELRYPMSKVLYSGIKNISYSEFSYNRLMLIGYK